MIILKRSTKSHTELLVDSENHICSFAFIKFQLRRNITIVVRFEYGWHLLLIEEISTTPVTQIMVQNIDTYLRNMAFPGMLWFSQFLFIQQIYWCLHVLSSLWIRTSGMPTRLQPVLWELAGVHCFENVLWFTKLSKLFLCMQDGICFIIRVFFPNSCSNHIIVELTEQLPFGFTKLDVVDIVGTQLKGRAVCFCNIRCFYVFVHNFETIVDLECQFLQY